MTAKDHTSGPGGGLKSWVNTQTPECSFNTWSHSTSAPLTVPMQQLHRASWSQEPGTKAHCKQGSYILYPRMRWAGLAEQRSP